MPAAYIGKVSDVFIQADLQLKKKPPKEKPIKYVPMPKIEGNPRRKGPLSVTPEFMEREGKKFKKQKKKERRETPEYKLIKLVSKREELKTELSTLRYGDKKINKRIRHIKYKLLNVETDITRLEKTYGIKVDNAPPDSKLGRFWKAIKKTAISIVEKIKNFFVRNKEIIEDVIIGSIPAIGFFILKTFFNRIG